MVAEPEPVIRRLLDFCNLSFAPECLEFHKTARTVQSLPSAALVRQPLRGDTARSVLFGDKLDGLRRRLRDAGVDVPPMTPDEPEFARMADALPMCLLDGALISTSTARISPLDRGFLFGDGIYEVVPCYGGRPFRLPAHFDRLQAGLDALGIPNPHSRARWAELIQALIAGNGGGDMGLYLEVTRGAGQGRDFLPQPDMSPTVFGFCWRLAPARQEQLERGIVAVTLEDIRWLRCDIKSVALLGPVMLRMEAERRGADEAILVRAGRLAEGSSSAVFVVRDGHISTAPASHERLPSITRLVVDECSGRARAAVGSARNPSGRALHIR